MQNLTKGSIFKVAGGTASQKSPGRHQSKLQEILTPASEISLKHTTQNFQRGQIVEHIQAWQKLTSDKVILQMVRGDNVEFENDTPIKHDAKSFIFSPEEVVEI